MCFKEQNNYFIIYTSYLIVIFDFLSIFYYLHCNDWISYVHIPPVVRCIYTTCGLWFVVYSVVSTLYHIPPVVRCLYTTSGLWFSIYSIIHTLFNHYNEESKKYWENQIWWQLNNLCKPQITIHLLYIDTLQQVECDIMY
jgi:hypothetical protein